MKEDYFAKLAKRLNLPPIETSYERNTAVGNSKEAPLEKSTRDKWNSRIADTVTPWTAYDLKHFCRLVAARPFEPIVIAWKEAAYELGPYPIDKAFTDGKERWLRARHVRIDGGARLSSPFGDHHAGLLNRALLSPAWYLLGFYDASTVLRDSVHPVLYLEHSSTREGVAFVADGSLNVLTCWRDTLASGKPNWRG